MDEGVNRINHIGSFYRLSLSQVGPTRHTRTVHANHLKESTSLINYAQDCVNQGQWISQPWAFFLRSFYFFCFLCGPILKSRREQQHPSKQQWTGTSKINNCNKIFREKADVDLYMQNNIATVQIPPLISLLFFLSSFLLLGITAASFLLCSLSSALYIFFPFFLLLCGLLAQSEKEEKMLLGKRPRPPMKRTTSMKEIDLDLSSSSVEMPLHSHNMKDLRNHQKATSETPLRRHPKVSDPRFISSAVSPRNHTRNSAVFMETASFLRACGLCNRRLGPGRDIYMYRYLSQRLCF